MKFTYFRTIAFKRVINCTPLDSSLREPNSEPGKALPLVGNGCSFKKEKNQEMTHYEAIVIFPTRLTLLFACETINDDTICKIQHIGIWWKKYGFKGQTDFKLRVWAMSIISFLQTCCLMMNLHLNLHSLQSAIAHISFNSSSLQCAHSKAFTLLPLTIRELGQRQLWLGPCNTRVTPV